MIYNGLGWHRRRRPLPKWPSRRPRSPPSCCYCCSSRYYYCYHDNTIRFVQKLLFFCQGFQLWNFFGKVNCHFWGKNFTKMLLLECKKKFRNCKGQVGNTVYMPSKCKFFLREKGSHCTNSKFRFVTFLK